MIVSAIAAMDRTGLIGDGMKMPWHLPRDLRRFRALTLGKPVIMGRRTLESLPGPLGGRLNIVLTHKGLPGGEGLVRAPSIPDALRIAEEHLASVGGREAMVIGGGVVFEATCRLWNRLLLTVVDGDFRGGTYFPVDQVSAIEWKLAGREFVPADARNAHAHWFLELERRRPDPEDGQGFDLVRWLQEKPHPVGESPGRSHHERA